MNELGNIIRKMGINATYKGYHYLLEAIEITLEDDNNLLHVTKNIYEEIGQRNRVSKETVEHNIRHVVEVCWNRGDREYLNYVAGCRLLYKPTNSEFIDFVAYFIKNKGLSEKKSWS